jgi:hypothetical protein
MRRSRLLSLLPFPFPSPSFPAFGAAFLAFSRFCGIKSVGKYPILFRPPSAFPSSLASCCVCQRSNRSNGPPVTHLPLVMGCDSGETVLSLGSEVSSAILAASRALTWIPQLPLSLVHGSIRSTGYSLGPNCVRGYWPCRVDSWPCTLTIHPSSSVTESPPNPDPPPFHPLHHSETSVDYLRPVIHSQSTTIMRISGRNPSLVRNSPAFDPTHPVHSIAPKTDSTRSDGLAFWDPGRQLDRAACTSQDHSPLLDDDKFSNSGPSNYSDLSSTILPLLVGILPVIGYSLRLISAVVSTKMWFFF